MARDAEQSAGNAGPTIDDDPEAIAVAINTYSQDVYVVMGDDTQSYPIHFEEVRGERTLEVRSEIDEVHKKTLGFRFIGGLLESDGGQELRELVEDLRETDLEPVDVIERRLADLEE